MLFLAAAQAFEEITREGRDPYVLDAEKHCVRMRDIMERLDDSIHKKWAEGRLSRSNVKSANQFA